MRLKHIETLIDSVEPYFLVKDLGLQIINTHFINELIQDSTDKRWLTKHEKELIDEFSFLMYNKYMRKNERRRYV